MKRLVTIFIGFVCLLLFVSGCRKEEMFDSENSQQKTTGSTRQSTEPSSGVPSVSTPADTSSTSEPDYEIDEEKAMEMLSSFGKRWVNYRSIDERNSSVRNYLTEDCIKENSIDVPVSVAVEATGEITQIFKSMEEDNAFVLFGTEETKGSLLTIVLTVHLAGDHIDSFVVQYVRQAY